MVANDICRYLVVDRLDRSAIGPSHCLASLHGCLVLVLEGYNVRLLVFFWIRIAIVIAVTRSIRSPWRTIPLDATVMVSSSADGGSRDVGADER